MDQLTKFSFAIRKLNTLPVPVKGRKEYYDLDCPGLTIVVMRTGTKVFYRYGRVPGEPHPARFRIGPFPDISIDEARTTCKVITGDIARGKNPVAEKRAARRQKTCLEAFEWYRDHVAKHTKKTWQREQRQWDKTFADWGKFKINEITREQLVERRDKLSVKNGKEGGPGAGRKFIDLARAIWREAKIMKWVDENIPDTVPIIRAEERDRFILPEELFAFFQAVFELRDLRSQHFILLALYLQARRANICSMEWVEIDWTREVWTIPRHKTKGKKPIIIPIARLAMDVLRERRSIAKPEERWVFPSTQSPTGHYNEPKAAWKSVLTKSNLTDLRVHDLRRTGASFQAIAGVPLLTIAKSLGHKSTRATEIYARLNTDPVRIAMDAASQAIRQHGEQEKS